MNARRKLRRMIEVYISVYKLHIVCIVMLSTLQNLVWCTTNSCKRISEVVILLTLDPYRSSVPWAMAGYSVLLCN